jgi:hypothetical protein
MKKLIIVAAILYFFPLLNGQVSKTINVTAGNLKTLLTPTELSTVTNLTITGAIDVRDFQTMRDDMPELAVLDAAGVSIVAFTGEGPSGNGTYPANDVPAYAFSNPNSNEGKASLTSVVLPSSVTSIGNFSFYNCFGLTSINIPSSIRSINIMAFNSCYNLTVINIPSSLYNIGYSVFTGITGPINVDSDNHYYSSIDGVLYNKTQTLLMQCTNSKTGNFNIPPSVISIGENAFFGCSELTSVAIPASVKAIGIAAFVLCDNLASVSIPSSVSAIGAEAFNSCNKLTAVYAYRNTPVDLSSSQSVFFNWSGMPGTLYVPHGSSDLYSVADQWKDFTTIIEMPEFVLSSNSLLVEATGGSVQANLTTAETWTVTKDQNWLTISQATGTGNTSFTFTASANPLNKPRFASVSISPSNLPSQSVIIAQAGSPKTISVTPGGLSTVLTAGELDNIFELIVTGAIDARDFKTMRDDMGWLTRLDLSNVNIAAYSGKGGTANSYINGKDYAANEIPQYAFIDPVKLLPKNTLSSIILPNSATSIDLGAFWLCSGLKTVYIPASITSIALQAFEIASGLITVDQNNNNYSSLDGVLYDKSKSKLIHYPTSKLGSFNIPSSVKTIGRVAFGSCSGLTSVTIPPSVSSIEMSAFSNCISLSTIITHCLTPVNLSSSSYVFYFVKTYNCKLYVPYGTSGLYANANQWKDFANIIELPGFSLSLATSTATAEGGSVIVDIKTEADWSAASDNSWLKVNPNSGFGSNAITLTVETNTSVAPRTAIVTVSAIGVLSQTISIFQSGSIKPLNVNAGGLSIALSASELNSTTKLTLTGTIDARDFKTIRDYMPVLAELDLSGVTIASYTGTEGTSGTGNFTYPANTIPNYALNNPGTFAGKPGLKTVLLPSAVYSIGAYALSGCSNLTSVNIPSSVNSIQFAAFNGCRSLVSVNIPSSVVSIELVAFGFVKCPINVDVNNPSYSSKDGVLFNKTQTSLIQCPASKTGAYTIPSSVISIETYAFNYCELLTSLTIPNSVNNIKDGAFYNCSGLTSIPLPSSVKSINRSVFERCYGLTSLVIPSSILTIGESAFSYCDRMISLTIPSSVTSIGNKAFYNCSGLTSITVLWPVPLDISSSQDVFSNVNKVNCTLKVPSGSKQLYSAANQWKDFANITQDETSTSINEDVDSHILIYPNPATEYLYVNIGDFSEMPDYSVKIISQIGKTVFETEVTQPLYEINVSSWSGSGLYILQVFDKNKVIKAVKKIIVQ